MNIRRTVRIHINKQYYLPTHTHKRGSPSLTGGLGLPPGPRIRILICEPQYESGLLVPDRSLRRFVMEFLEPATT